MAEPVLEIRNLEVRYGAVPAVRDVSFSLGRGEILGIVGPNGAGKSTMLLAIMGILRASRGEVLLDGRSILGLTPEAISRRGLALVPEGRRIFAEFSVEENMRLGLLARSSSKGADEDLDWVYSLFPVVREMRGRMAGQLSGGQQQQLAIARGLISSPKILLLDEPTLGLSLGVLSVLFDALGVIRDRGVTILLIEQRAQLAVGFADRTHVMRDGRLTTMLTPQDADDAQRLSDAYFGS